MKYLLLITAMILAGCQSDVSNYNMLACVNLDAASLVSFFSATTAVSGLAIPTDGNGDPILTQEQIISAFEQCNIDPSQAPLLEAIRQLNTVPEGI